MNNKGKLPTFEELMAGIRTKQSLAQAKKRAEEERKADLVFEVDPRGYPQDW